MKAVRFVTILIGLGLLLFLMPLTVAADDPIVVASATSPFGAPYIDNQAHPIKANADLWYRFDYLLSDSGKPRMTSLRLLYGNKSGVDFEIYEPQDMSVYSDKFFSPVIGRGMPEMLACSTGWCEGDDLVWNGALGASGTYFVRIINHTQFATTFLLSIDGKGVVLSAPIAVTATSGSATTTPNLDDPNRAVMLDGKQQLIPAQSALWFQFNYKIDREKSVVDHIRLVYGVKSGLRFQVYTPEILGNWWENDPIGVGVPEMVPCSTGMCKSDDLIWVGAFGASGTYYVRVINDSPYVMPAILTME